MIRMRIQLPDALYRDAKRLAEEYEITLAEVMRRGLEHMIRIYPPRDATTSNWRLPEPRPLGRFRTPEEQWRELANEGDQRR